MLNESILRFEWLDQKKQQTSFTTVKQELNHEPGMNPVELKLQKKQHMLNTDNKAEPVCEKYAGLYSQIPSGYFTLNQEGKIIESNTQVTKMLDIESPVIKGNYFVNYLTNDTKPIFAQFLEKVFISNENITCELRLLRESDTPAHILLNGNKSKNGEHCLASMIDISRLKLSEEKLRENNSRLELAMQASNMAWWEMDMSTGQVIFDQRKAAMLGYPPEKFQHYNDFMAMVHPEDYEETMNAMRSHLEGLTAKYETDYRILTKSQGYKWFHDTGSVVKRDINGKPLYITGLVIDISNRKQSEELLRASEIRYRRLFESAKDGILILDADTGLIVDANPYLIELLGFSEEQLLKKVIWEIGLFKDIAANKEKFQVFQQKKYARYDDLPLETADGRKINIELVSNLYISDQRRVIQCNIRDITERSLAELHARKIIAELDESHQKLLNVVDNQRRTEKALRNSETLLHTLIQTIPDLIWLKDTEGTYLACNTMFGRFFGTTETEIVGKTDFDFVDKELAEFFLENDRMAMLAGMPTSNEEWITLADNGQRICLDTIKTSMFDAYGKLIGVLGIGHDITERKKTQEALLSSETKYRSFFENSMDAILLTIPDGQTLSANPAACRMFGYSEEELIKLGRNGVVDLTDPNLLSMIAERDLNEKVQCKLTFIRKNGEKFLAEISSSLFKNHEGQIRTSMIIRDITERERNEELLRESEERLRITLEETQIATFDWNLKNDIYYVTPTYYTMLGYEPKEGPADFGEWINLAHPDDQEMIAARIRDAYTIAEPNYQYEARLKHADGTYRWIQIIGHILERDKNNKPMRLIGVRIDMTERKQAEKELIKAKEKAEESDRLKSAFLANMSHEIRTPMNGILGFTELLKQPMLSGEEQQEYISIIEKSGTRMLNIINDIVSISKIESGQMEISNSETNVNEQLEFIYTFFKPEVEGKGLQFGFNAPLSDKEAIFNTDQEKVYAILTNLVKNAIKFTNKGSIELGYEKKGGFLEFYVRDTGAGIHHEKKELIFERFRQGSESLSRNYEGAGLGLSISKAYVNMLGGEIWLESEFGKGSDFYFTIPYDGQAVQETIQITTVSDIQNGNISKKLKILIAEDDKISGILISIIAQHFSKEVLKVQNGLDAVETCRTNPDIDLVLMDIKMPQMGGYEATRRIRQFNKKVIIIAQTAEGLTNEREKAKEAGFNDYILKPINCANLTKLIKTYFN